LLCVQCKTPDDGQRNCSKLVQFHSKNKVKKLVHLVGFIIRTSHAFCFQKPSHSSSYFTQNATPIYVRFLFIYLFLRV